MNITSQQIRQKYLDFFEKQGHKIVPSSPLIPENDPTTLFTGSGMQPMVPYLLGEKHPLGNRICDSQKSFRSGDIEDIGDNRHTTFFEMLGNWSLGDYFKEKQVPWMFEFLTKELGLNPKNLYVTVFRGNEKYGISKDTEAVELWRKEFKNVGIDALDVDFAEEKGMQGGRIFYCPEEKNWWSRAGIPGNMPEGEPGGPDSEMFWDFGAELKMHEVSEWKDEPCHPNCDCGRFLEIGNNVFMQFQKSGDGFKELANKNIDFGGGLERLAAAIKNNPDVFFGDLFDGIRTKIEELSGKKYGENPKETKAFRVVMDHLRASTFLICDGAVPSNKDQGYFTRRLLRRAIRFARDLGINGGLSKEVALEVIKEYKDHYKELEAKKDFIVTEIEKEEKQFLATLENGLKEFEKLVKGLEIAFEKTGKKIDTISGDKAFKLYDTYGFPLEITQELAEEKGLKIDVEGFKEAFKKHKDLSRAGAEQKFKGGLADSAEETTALHTAAHLMLAGIRKVLGADIHQKGSNITAERLRFDFNYPEKVPEDKLKEIENYVNNVIEKNCDMILDEIKKSEAESDKTIEGSFWEKYPEIVKVYTVKDSEGNIYSRELCGGPHITNTSTMGRFRITKEESSSAGVRRIKAVLEKLYMLKLEFPNKSHKLMWEKLIQEWGEKSAPEDLFCSDTYEGFLELIEQDLVGRENRVKGHFYFLFDDNIEGEIIGGIQIRHKIPLIKISPDITEEVGHIGYGIAPKYRRRGYATKMLKLALEKIKELKLDIDNVLITCDVTNIGSAKVIENNGGVFEKVNLRNKKRYWISL